MNHFSPISLEGRGSGKGEAGRVPWLKDKERFLKEKGVGKTVFSITLKEGKEEKGGASLL